MNRFKHLVDASTERLYLLNKPSVLGQVTSGYCSRCCCVIGEGYGETKGTVTKVTIRGKKSEEEVQAVLCAYCLKEIKRRGREKITDRA